MKKFIALLTTMMLLCMMLSTAMADSVYTEQTPAQTQVSTVTHTLTLTESDMTQLPYNVTYTFTVGDEVTIVQPTDIVNKSLAVEGKPSIAAITYTPASVFTNKTCTQELAIDWSNVKIKEPGVYRWAVTKSVTDTDPIGDATNNSETLYLFAYATDNGGSLVISSVGLTHDANMSAAKGNLNDSYPVQTLNLSITKNVTGNQGSRDQYFKFTVSLTSPTGSADQTYDITGHDVTVPQTAYHNSTTNVEKITVSNGTGSVELWLKHGQTVTIKNILYGTAYTITESENTDYTVKSSITGDTTGTTADGATASDTSLTASTTVAFTNDKQAVVPTGVVLNSGAPIMGLLLAAALLLVVNAGKRKTVVE
ncbi:MAG: hypothetical protein IJE07_03045 [Clostridia bacterium]|nr:hypothetical protein [Clostridia bacterium]